MLEYDRLFIGGDWVPSVDSDVLEVRSPATGQVVGRVPMASAGDVDAAVVAARKAFDEGPWPQPVDGRASRDARACGKALAPFGPELDQLVPLESGIPVCFMSGSSSFPLFDYYVDLGRTYEVEQITARAARRLGPRHHPPQPGRGGRRRGAVERAGHADPHEGGAGVAGRVLRRGEDRSGNTAVLLPGRRGLRSGGHPSGRPQHPARRSADGRRPDPAPRCRPGLVHREHGRRSHDRR